MSSAHLSRVLSPVYSTFTPSLFAERVSLYFVPPPGTVGVIGVEGVAAAEELAAFFAAGRPAPAKQRQKIREDAPGGFVVAFVPPPAAFSRSTSCFHFFTISFASSETGLEGLERNLPTARPALLS